MSNEFKIKKGLVVEGDARVTGAILDSTNAPGTSGQVLTSTVTGTDWKSLAEISGVDGTGTANYLSKWADADTITNSIVYDNGTNVGIGTTAPVSKLDIRGVLSFPYISTVTGTTVVKFSESTDDEFVLKANFTGFGATGNSMSFGSGVSGWASDIMTWRGDGNVGIGTTNPIAKQHNLIASSGTALLLNNAAGGSGAYVDLDFNTYSTAVVGYANAAASIRAIDDGSYSGHITFRTKGSTVGATQSERMRITGAGNVGIGTSSPSAKLDVAGTVNAYGNGSVALQWGDTSALGALSFDTSANPVIRSVSSKPLVFQTNGANERMRITSAGNVGIGTTAPAYTLDVNGTFGANTFASIQGLDTGNPTASANELRVSGYGIMGNRGSLYFTNAEPTGNIQFGIGATHGAAPKMYIASTGNVGIGTTAPENKLHVQQSDVFTGIHTTAGVRVKSDGASAINNYHGTIALSRGTGGVAISAVQEDTDSDVMGMAFFTHPSATGGDAAVEKMRLDQNGNLGIGTTSPSAKLEVVTSSGQEGIIINNSNGIQTFQLGHLTSNDSYFQMKNNSDVTEVLFRTDNGSSYINTGNVGIGTTSPAQKLDVVGNIRVTGSVLWAGSVGNTFINGASTIDTIRFGTLDTERMRITSDGNVSIGNTNDNYKLDVRSTKPGSISVYGKMTAASSSGSFGIQGENTSTAGTAYGIGGYASGAATTNVGGIFSATGATNNYGLLVTNGNVGIGTTAPTFKLDVSGTARINTTSTSLIKINSTGSGTVGRSLIQIIRNDGTEKGWDFGTNVFKDNSDNFTFREVGGTGDGLTRILIQKVTGNVGIGTTAPGTKLQVDGTIRATGTTGIVDVDPLYGAFRFYNGSTFYGGFYNDAVLSSGNAVDLVSYVATGDYYIGSATRGKVVKVEQGGNVGIGTTSPTEKLDVNGVVNATSFSAGGTAGFTGTVNFPSNPLGSQILDFQGGLLVSVS